MFNVAKIGNVSSTEAHKKWNVYLFLELFFIHKFCPHSCLIYFLMSCKIFFFNLNYMLPDKRNLN